MEIKVTGLFGAFDHFADKPTYAIRITSTFTHGYEGLVPLSGDYKVIRSYIFDDMGKADGGLFKVIRFNSGIAEMIIRDFIEGKDGCERLLVHCHRGRSRGPAVAKALKDLFSLEDAEGEMDKNYPRLNHLVYDTMMRTGERMGISSNVPAL